MCFIHKWSKWQKESKDIQIRTCNKCNIQQRSEFHHIHEFDDWMLVDGQRSYRNNISIGITVQMRKCIICGYTQMLDFR